MACFMIIYGCWLGCYITLSLQSLLSSLQLFLFLSVFLFLPYFSALSSFFYYYFRFFNFIITSLMQVPPNQILPNHAHPLSPQMARPTRPNAPPPPLLQPIKKALYPRQLHLLLPSGRQQQLALLRLPR